MEDPAKKHSFYEKLAIVGEGQNLRNYSLVKDLKKNHMYKTNNFRFVSTKFGKATAVDLDDDIWIFLPNRYKYVIQETSDLDELNATKPTLRYIGQGERNMNLVIIECSQSEMNEKKGKKTQNRKVKTSVSSNMPLLPSYHPNFELNLEHNDDKINYQGNSGFLNTQL